MLAPLGITFVISLFASTMVALTLTPVLCSYLLNKPKNNGEEHDPYLVRKLKSGYGMALRWTLCHKKVVLGAIGVHFDCFVGDDGFLWT